MSRSTKAGALGTLALVAMLVIAACSSTDPTATPLPTATPAPTPNVLASVQGIIDPNNDGWPRQVEALNGLVTIQQKPLRIHTISLGHDEVVYALVPAERVIAVGRFTQDAVYSNVATRAQQVVAIGREPEQIIAQSPDIVIASPFAKPELLEALGNVVVTVIQTRLDNDPQGRIQDILFMGYVLGEEERAKVLAEEVQSRYAGLIAVTHAVPVDSRPSVASLTLFSDKIYTAGSGSTEGAIIEAAGGINVAAEVGLERNPVISLESVIAMAPEVIFIPQPGESGEAFRQQLLENEALAEVPAIKEGRVFLSSPAFFTTLSFWNLRGAEELGKVLWPAELGDKEFPPFSFPE